MYLQIIWLNIPTPLNFKFVHNIKTHSPTWQKQDSGVYNGMHLAYTNYMCRYNIIMFLKHLNTNMNLKNCLTILKTLFDCC